MLFARAFQRLRFMVYGFYETVDQNNGIFIWCGTIGIIVFQTL